MATAKTARIVLILLMLFALTLVAFIAAPFGTAFFLAAVLSGALQPWMDGLAGFFRGRRSLAAGLLTLGVLLAAVVPLAVLAATAVKEIAGGFQWLREALGAHGMSGLLERLPGPLRQMGARLATDVPQALDQLQALAASEGGRAAAAVGGIISATTSAVIQTAIMLVTLFFLLADGQRLVDWLDEAIPLKRGQFVELLADFRKVTLAVILSTLASAGVQTVVAFIGYLIGGVPNALFFTLLTFVLALMPALGASVGTAAVALLQLVTGHTASAVFLGAWIVPVALVDNVVKPLVLKGKGGLEIHAAVIFFSLLGGLAAFGLVGVIAGPLIMAFLVSVLRMYRRDYGPGADPLL